MYTLSFLVAGSHLMGGDGCRRNRDYLMPHQALAKIIRAKFRDALTKAGLFEEVPPEVWQSDWGVDIRAVGKTALTYLSN